MQGAQGSPEAAAFLKAQRSLVELQIKHFDEERHLSIAAARRKRFSDRLKYGLQGLGMLAAVGIIVGFAVMTWQAVNDRGLVILRPSPRCPTSRGADRTGRSSPTAPARPAGGHGPPDQQQQPERLQHLPSAARGMDMVKVEIPETGVSLDEVDRWLRSWLGHETRVAGEITRAPGRLAMSAAHRGRGQRSP